MSYYEYIPNFYSDAAAFDTLWNELSWEKRDDAPRKECWMNDFNRSYTYGKGKGVRTYQANSWHPLVLTIREVLKEKVGYFEGCFANGYTGEHDWLGWHADDDPGIDHTKPIVVISFGQARAIQIKYNREISESVKSENRQEFMLESGSAFLMPAGSQFTHVHRIPKVGHKVNPRISLTFRGLIKTKEEVQLNARYLFSQ